MIGVVLWSDPQACKAVFWCEDQGDLAYYSADPLEEPQAAALYAGDMVQFDVTAQREFRKASNARLVREAACDTLPDDLKQTADQAGAMRCKLDGANVIALNLNNRPQRDFVKNRSSGG